MKILQILMSPYLSDVRSILKTEKRVLREIFRKSPISSSRHDLKTFLSNSNLYLIVEEGGILWKKEF